MTLLDAPDETISHKFLISNKDVILVTGASGFIGFKVVETLLNYGFGRVRCLVRPSSNLENLNRLASLHENNKKLEIIKGNLLSKESCERAVEEVQVILHLAAGREKSFADAFANSVITTRNLVQSIAGRTDFKRLVNVSSLAVYTNKKLKRGALLDETCEINADPAGIHEAYIYCKIKQDKILAEYAERYKVPYVIVRPGPVIGPGKMEVTGRVGIDTFGVFVHLGGSNIIPFVYIENCAEAIVLAGITACKDREVFNIVDDDLPTSREFLKAYKKNVQYFRTVFCPYPILYFLCYIWEKYAEWSDWQLPPVFNRNRCEVYWKGNTYTNLKLKSLLAWKPRVPFSEGMKYYFGYLRQAKEKK